jgi:PAS domain S-box-containing protein
MLKRLGYNVVGMAATGEEAVGEIARTHPDLVLMDIRLQGDMDGIQTAEHVMVHHDIPVTYLTAYADETTLERAKVTLPYGYILKPFEERDLRTTIELALYKYRMNHMLGKMEGWYASTLQSLGDAVITASAEGNITFMNAAAETLTGWTLENAYRKKLMDVFKVVKKSSREVLPNVVDQVAREKAVVRESEPVALINHAGQDVAITFSRGPIKAEDGSIDGVAIVFHDLDGSAVKK